MATKISGIKGINISKSSVLKDGSKKTSGNESFRDTSNGTTRDNSGNSALDAATIKMLLGQTELMAKKAAQIEQNMRIAQQKEEERQKQLAQRIKEREKREKEKNEKESEAKFDSYYNKIDKGVINTGLAQFLGPAGVLVGKGLNTLGVPIERMGKWALRKSGGLISSAFGGIWGSKNKTDDSETNALSVNRREEAAAPVNNLRTSVVKRLDTIIKLLGGRRGGEDGKKEGLLSKLLSPLASGIGGFLLGRLLPWLGKKLLFLGGIGAIAYGLHKLWQWARDKFGPHWADGIVAGTSRALKAALQSVGNGIQKAANSLKALRQGGTSAKALKGISNTLNKLASGNKATKFLFGRAAEKATKSARAASIAQASGKLNAAGRMISNGGKLLTKFGKAAGIVGNLVIAGEAGYDAYNKFKSGDKRGGYGAIGRGAGSIAGGWAGAAAGAALGQLAIPIPVVGALVGGVAGALGLGALGSKVGQAIGENGYDLLSGQEQNQMVTEGQMTTESPNYSSLLLQNESNSMQKEILDTLRQIEFNLNPEIQKDLDESYIENIKRSFDKTPEASSNYFNDYTTLNRPMLDTVFREMRNQN